MAPQKDMSPGMQAVLNKVLLVVVIVSVLVIPSCIGVFMGYVWAVSIW